MGEPRGEAVAGGGDEFDLDRPIFPRLENLDLGFALANEAQRHGLHAPRRAASRQLAPQHRRQGEADEVVEGAAREISLHQLVIEVAGVTEGVKHRRFRHFVEDDALDIDTLQGAALLQDFLDMPGNGFSLAIGVGGEIKALGALDGARDLAHPLGCLVLDFPGHGEVLIGPHRAILGREVADMAIARQDRIALAEIFVDGLRLGG